MTVSINPRTLALEYIFDVLDAAPNYRMSAQAVRNLCYSQGHLPAMVDEAIQELTDCAIIESRDFGDDLLLVAPSDKWA